MILLLVALCRAGDLEPLPTRPKPSVPVQDECAEAVGLDVGDPVPASLVAGGKVVCAAVAVPASQAADALALDAWATAIDQRYRLDTVYLQGQVRVAESERDWYKARLEEAQRVKFWSQPWVQRTIGGTSVVLVAGLTVWGFSQVP